MERKNSQTPSNDHFDLELFEYLQSLLTPNRRARFVDVVKSRTRKITVVLENLSQPHNISAVLRSCDCFGVQDVTILDHRETFEIAKDVALGAEKWLTINRVRGRDAVSKGVAQLKREGYQILVTSPHGDSLPLHEVPIDRPSAIVFGTELEGISEEMEGLADGRIHIPMVGFTESFNVSVAAAICLNDLTCRLRATDGLWKLPETEQRSLLLQWTRRSLTNCDQIERRFRDERVRS